MLPHSPSKQRRLDRDAQSADDPAVSGSDMNALECAACSRSNPASATVCSGCGAELVRLCAGCGRRNPADGNFCSQCGLALRSRTTPSASYTPRHLVERILTSRASLEGERKQVTVLFLDVAGSMKLADQLGPEPWHRLLDQFFLLLAEGIHRFEGTINQYTGDGVMALFGAPLAVEDHAQKACHAALELRRRLHLWNDELRRTHGVRVLVRMGLNSGEVVVGKIGDDLRMDYTAQGVTVGLAARMEQAAAAEQILLSDTTAAMAAGFFELEDLGAVAGKRADGSLRAFALLGEGPLRTRLDAARWRGLRPLLGRAEEWADLQRALDRALTGHGQIVGVVGPAGIGKSRLCQEFVDSNRSAATAIAEAHCPSHAPSLPFFGIVELLRSYFGVGAKDTPRQVRERVTQRLRGLGSRMQIAPLLEALGFPPRGHAVPEAPERRLRLIDLSRRLVQAQSAVAPLLLLVDDAHWLDAESDEILSHLVEALGWTRTLLLLNFRPDYTPRRHDVSYYRRLDLRPLSMAVCDELLGSMLGDDDASAGLRAAIRERADGNPFFLEQIAQSLAEEGLLVRDPGSPGRYSLRQPFDWEDLARRVPPSLEALIASRIDRLPEAAKLALLTAAVIGRRFSRSLLDEVSQGDAEHAVAWAGGDRLDGALSTLCDADLLDRIDDGGAYRFRHPLTQEVAYGSLLQARRTRTHEAVARALMSQHPERLGEHAPEIGHHWAAAGKSYDARLWRYRAALQVTNIQVARRREATKESK